MFSYNITILYKDYISQIPLQLDMHMWLCSDQLDVNKDVMWQIPAIFLKRQVHAFYPISLFLHPAWNVGLLEGPF